ELSDEEQAMAKLKEAISVEQQEVGALRLKLTITVPRTTLDERLGEQFAELKRDAIGVFDEYFPSMKNRRVLAEKLIDDTVGYGVLAPLIEDPELEEIMINGYKRPIFVYHKRHGSCKANITIKENRMLDLLVLRIALTVGKKVNAKQPLLDARLLGGDRANATDSLVTPFGPTLTIRKFTKIPLSIVDLIENNTLTAELAAFLWVMVEGMNIEPMNLIVSGGAGSGKTTTLDVLATFVPYKDRVITIEDTLELDLGSRKNWIQMESKPETDEAPEVTMNDLLKNALRMRPDRILVGEVRGPEAQSLFVAMDIGHRGCMGTLHSNTAKEMLIRLTTEPMSVPQSMLSLLNLMIMQSRMYIRGKGVLRRITQVAEVSSMDGKPLLSNTYEYDRSTDRVKRTDVPSHILEVLADATVKTKKEVMREISVRKKVFEWMIKNGIKSNPDVDTIIQHYYHNPETILEMVAKDLPKAHP
ncbi:Flp pilus assembly complex ATPase component TadA, partial [Candidatus Micrarchaeota archaeon]|nr:Flp pilus assembly complex ATPase component TadA [Candidatus Micrarchaeota archaeon]